MANGNGGTIIQRVAVGLGSAGIVAAVGVYGAQMAMGQKVEDVKSDAEAALILAHTNAANLSAVLQWIEVDRERTEREHDENVKAHRRIEVSLKEIEKEVRK